MSEKMAPLVQHELPHSEAEGRFATASPTAQRLWGLVAQHAGQDPERLVRGFDWGRGERTEHERGTDSSDKQAELKQLITQLISDQEMATWLIEALPETSGSSSGSLLSEIQHRKTAHLSEELSRQGIEVGNDLLQSWLGCVESSVANDLQSFREHGRAFRTAMNALSKDDQRRVRPYLKSMAHTTTPAHLSLEV